MLILVTTTGARSGRRVQRCWSQADGGDIDDGLPRGFLAGAIVKMWVALRLNWAGELLLSEAKNCPGTSVPNA
jgi:hypothetical protein